MLSFNILLDEQLAIYMPQNFYRSGNCYSSLRFGEFLNFSY